MKTDQLRYIERKIEELISGRANAGQPVNRSDLITAFGISEISASKHIQLFIGRNPGFLTYDMSRKAYFKTTEGN